MDKQHQLHKSLHVPPRSTFPRWSEDQADETWVSHQLKVLSKRNKKEENRVLGTQVLEQHQPRSLQLD